MAGSGCRLWAHGCTAVVQGLQPKLCHVEEAGLACTLGNQTLPHQITENQDLLCRPRPLKHWPRPFGHCRHAHDAVLTRALVPTASRAHTCSRARAHTHGRCRRHLPPHPHAASYSAKWGRKMNTGPATYGRYLTCDTGQDEGRKYWQRRQGVY